VVLRPAGLPSGSGAVLVVESDANVVRTTDPRCTYARARATCQISGTDLSPLTFEVVAPLGAQVTASLTPAEQDADAGNNAWRSDLGDPYPSGRSAASRHRVDRKA
jgi:hypothetical protein